jgi:hypothetical protein
MTRYDLLIAVTTMIGFAFLLGAVFGAGCERAYPRAALRAFNWIDGVR